MARTADERRALLQKYGYIAPDNDGFFVETGQAAAQSFVGSLRGLGATVNEITGDSRLQDYFQGVLDRNQQWNESEDGSIGSYIGRAVGSAGGSTAGTLAAATAGSLLGGPKVGLAAGIATAFSQSFGENVQRNRAAGYSEGKAYGMAFLESGVDSVIENLPFGIVGKSGRVIAQAGRINAISKAGKRELLNLVGKKIAAATGQKETQNALLRMGKSMLASGGGEGLEEGLQYLNSYVNQSLGGDPNANISVEELADNIAKGFIGGFFLGGVQNTPMLFTSGKRGNALNSQGVANEMGTAEQTAAFQSSQAPQLFDTLVSEVGNALGIKIDFMDTLDNGAELQKKTNGMYDKSNKTLYLNRNTYSVNPSETLGHELKHYIDDNIPELSKAFNTLLEAGKNDAGRQEVAEIMREFGIDEAQGNAEFSADMFGKLFARPDTWQKMATYLDNKTPGMGEKFLQTLKDFYALVKTQLEKLVGINPEAETYLNNVEALQDEAARMLAELRRRNGTASQEENVVGVKGNTNVESIPVAQINVDAQRFQFKSNTSKFSGVDESNKLGGDWNVRSAGNLYLWQDKSGKIYVVNGHHRLELAQRNNVENINAIIDRESDGVTAEQARRNGVLINILDEQGDVRDYAEFVRSENLSEDEAKAQGITARPKGRLGFALGKSGDTLYEAYRNDEIPENKAVIIAEVAQGNEAIEYAGIRLAVDRKLSVDALRQTLKLAAQNSSGKKNTASQGSLFDMVDDSVLREWELIGKAAATHIEEIRARIKAAKNAIKNPEAAKSLDVKTSKGSKKLLAQAQDELARWENYATDPEIMAQLREEAGIAPQEDVAGAENAHATQETTQEVVSEKENTNAAVDDSLFALQPETVDNGNNPSAAENLESKQEVTETETPEENSVVANKKDKTVDDFLLRFAPQIQAIVSKNAIKSRGDQYNDDLLSEAYMAAAKAYENYDPAKGASLDTAASTYVDNALKDFNRKQHREFNRTGMVSLNQTNEEGTELIDNVADEKASAVSEEKSEDLLGDYRRWKASLKRPVDRKILDYSEQGLPPSEIARKAGIGMTADGVKARLKELAVAARTEGELQFSRKRIFTGSAASYDKPSLQYVGTGEGAQVYGWGLYGSESEKVARWYAEQDADRKNYALSAVIKYMGTPYTEQELFDYSKNGDVDFKIMLAHVFSRGGVQNAISELEQQIKMAKQKNREPELYEWQEELLKDIKEAQDDIEYIGIKLEGKRHLYNQTFWPNKEEDLLDWDDALTDEQREKILKQADKEGILKYDLINLRQNVLDALEDIHKELPYDDKTSSFFYKKLAIVLGSPKAASEFLYRAGIDGVTYIGDSSGVRNYVAFSDQDIQIDEHIQYSRKRLHEQINPIVRNGVVRDEYADLLAKRKYDVQTLEELQNKAFEWIIRNGGVIPAVEQILKDKAPGNPAVAEVARRLLMESNDFRNYVSRADRTRLYEMEHDVREDWGLTGRAMQLAVLSLKDIASVQAVLNRLHKHLTKGDLLKLRNQIKDKLDIDIFDLPEDIVKDKSKLDAVLREHLIHTSSLSDKFYEYYINAILSGPTTHLSNLLGNTANAVYELGIKRFTEALVNVVSGRKTGASFSEFRQMVKAMNWSNAAAAAKMAFDKEVLDPAGKFLENNNIAIGGKTGRIIRVPGRALKAADAFAKALIEPMETTAFAYRLGVSQGLSGSDLSRFIQKQLTDVDSEAYRWGKERARELTFQEDPGTMVNRLMALRESGGVMGTALRLFLPFIKTPYNILRQGIRKGPLGTLNLAAEYGKLALGKRKFDDQLVARTAEQLLAWGALMAFYGLSDDDELPILTGSSAAYGSPEYGFKSNKVPPYSIRLGNTWYSYQRIEPLATGLAAIADGIQTLRDVRNGKDATQAIKSSIGAAIKVAGEKSFLDSIGEIIKIYQDPERNIMRPATNLASSVMPALFRQTRQAFIEEVGDSNSRNQGAEWWKDQFNLIINRAGITAAIPKVDYFGRDVKKDDWSNSWLSDVGRLLPIKRFEVDRNMDKAEQLIWNYNQKNPNEEYYPGIPRGTFTLNGAKMYFSGEDYREFATQAGQLAHKQINNAISAGRLNVENPDAEDIKLIKKIFTRSRKETQQKMINRSKKL